VLDDSWRLRGGPGRRARRGADRPGAYWKVGQYTSFAGAEREQSFDCHFAGEHTSIDFQGYLNGGVETGQRAVTEILADLRT
jgi:monoamine oxidase